MRTGCRDGDDVYADGEQWASGCYRWTCVDGKPHHNETLPPCEWPPLYLIPLLAIPPLTSPRPPLSHTLLLTSRSVFHLPATTLSLSIIYLLSPPLSLPPIPSVCLSASTFCLAFHYFPHLSHLNLNPLLFCLSAPLLCIFFIYSLHVYFPPFIVLSSLFRDYVVQR